MTVDRLWDKIGNGRLDGLEVGLKDKTRAEIVD